MVWHPDDEWFDLVANGGKKHDLEYRKWIQEHDAKKPKKLANPFGDLAKSDTPTPANEYDMPIERGLGTSHNEAVRRVAKCFATDDYEGLVKTREQIVLANIDEDGERAFWSICESMDDPWPVDVKGKCAKWKKEKSQTSTAKVNHKEPDSKSKDLPTMLEWVKYCGYEIAWDVLRDGAVVRPTSNKPHWVDVDESMLCYLIDRMSVAGYTMSRDKAWEKIKALGSRFNGQYHRNFLAEYFGSLPDATDDDLEYLDKFLIDAYGAEDTALNRYASAALFIGPIARTLNPGTSIRCFPVLVGPPDIGKSYLINQMLPTSFVDADGASMRIRDRYWSSSFHLARGYDELVFQTAGKVLVESSEMVGFRKADADLVKTFLTAAQHTVRKKFDKVTTDMPNATFLIGTANGYGDFINHDPALSDRMVCVELSGGKVDARAIMENDRDRLFAAALKLYKSGVDLACFPDHLKRDQRISNRNYMAVDDTIEVAIDLLYDLGRTAGWNMIDHPRTPTEIVDRLVGEKPEYNVIVNPVKIGKALSKDARFMRARNRTWKIVPPIDWSAPVDQKSDAVKELKSKLKTKDARDRKVQSSVINPKLKKLRWDG